MAQADTPGRWALLALLGAALSLEPFPGMRGTGCEPTGMFPQRCLLNEAFRSPRAPAGHEASPQRGAQARPGGPPSPPVTEQSLWSLKSSICSKAPGPAVGTALQPFLRPGGGSASRWDLNSAQASGPGCPWTRRPSFVGNAVAVGASPREEPGAQDPLEKRLSFGARGPPSL